MTKRTQEILQQINSLQEDELQEHLENTLARL